MSDMDAAPQKAPRIALVDMLRGAAILGVVFYHFCWDLRYFEFIAVDVSREFGWWAFARSLLFSFLFLAGVSLVLAHGRGMRWMAFAKRFAIIGGAALLVTLGTWWFSPQAFVYFGVLHAIALFSLMAVPALRAPLWLVAALGAVWIALPVFYANPFFNTWYWSWIGFWTVPPLTEDLVPLFPGFGFTLLGVAITRWLVARPALATRVAGVKASNRWLGFLTLCGRWSLVIYLVHQPILLGLMTPIANYAYRETPEERAANFSASCFASCLERRQSANQCQAYCGCALEQVEADDLWDALNALVPSEEQQQSIGAVTRLCNAMVGFGEAPDSK